MLLIFAPSPFVTTILFESKVYPDSAEAVEVHFVVILPVEVTPLIFTVLSPAFVTIISPD